MSRFPDPAISEQDRIALVILGALFVVVGGAAATWHRLVTELLDRRILLPTGPDVLLVLPAAGGAGLDLRRAAVGGAMLLLALAAAVAGRQRRRAREAMQASGGEQR
ncbi:hypothetical protein [Kineococcus sp. SYSU DK003]|uniref:hypothetical protein n=1 Tax=Kineococcus sp. SYSU DK003 TaxID=3383124 RepID=UPI003D7D54DD